MQAKYAALGDDVNVIMINIEGEDIDSTAAPFAEKHGLTLPHFAVESMDDVEAFAVQFIPHHAVISVRPPARPPARAPGTRHALHRLRVPARLCCVLTRVCCTCRRARVSSWRPRRRATPSTCSPRPSSKGPAARGRAVDLWQAQ